MLRHQTSDLEDVKHPAYAEDQDLEVGNGAERDQSPDPKGKGPAYLEDEDPEGEDLETGNEAETAGDTVSAGEELCGYQDLCRKTVNQPERLGQESKYKKASELQIKVAVLQEFQSYGKDIKPQELATAVQILLCERGKFSRSFTETLPQTSLAISMIVGTGTCISLLVAGYKLYHRYGDPDKKFDSMGLILLLMILLSVACFIGGFSGSFRLLQSLNLPGNPGVDPERARELRQALCGAMGNAQAEALLSRLMDTPLQDYINRYPECTALALQEWIDKWGTLPVKLDAAKSSAGRGSVGFFARASSPAQELRRSETASLLTLSANDKCINNASYKTFPN